MKHETDELSKEFLEVSFNFNIDKVDDVDKLRDHCKKLMKLFLTEREFSIKLQEFNQSRDSLLDKYMSPRTSPIFSMGFSVGIFVSLIIFIVF